jgi:hypothetical protein
MIARFNRVLNAITKEHVSSEIAEQLDLSLEISKKTLDGLVFVGLASTEAKAFGRLCVPTNHYIRVSDAQFTFENYLSYKKYMAREKAEIDNHIEALAQPDIPGGRIIRFSETGLAKRHNDQYKQTLAERRENRKIEPRKNSTLYDLK